MPLTNLMAPGGYIGPGTATYPVSNAPNGAVVYVSSLIGADVGGRVTRMGTPATVTSASAVQGPYGDPAKPLASVWGPNGAWNYCKANRGDLIVVLPGHVETLSGLVPILPASTTVLGIGYGTGRPTIQWVSTVPAMTLGVGCQLQNLLFDMTGIAGVVNGFNLSTDGNQIINCRIIMASATRQALAAILLSAGATGFLLADSEIDSTAAPGAAEAIITGAAIPRSQFINNWIHGDFSAAPIVSSTANPFTEMAWESNFIVQKNGTAKVVLSGGTADTGIIANNMFMAGAGLATANGMISGFSNPAVAFCQNFAYYAKASGGPYSGILVPTAGVIP